MPAKGAKPDAGVAWRIAVMPIAFKPLHQHFAAEVPGFDMRQPIDPATAQLFERAIDRYGILVFPAQQVDDAQQLAFTANFGPPDIGRKKAVKAAGGRIPEEMIDLSNLDENGYVIDPDHRRVLSLLGTRLWHTDSSYQRPAAKYSMLRAVAVPQWGGETEFADCRAAYDALPDILRAEVEDRFAEHWVHHSRSTLGWEPTEEEIRGAMPPVRWPLVRVHPGSGRKALYIGAHARRVLGLRCRPDVFCCAIFRSTQRNQNSSIATPGSRGTWCYGTIGPSCIAVAVTIFDRSATCGARRCSIRHRSTSVIAARNCRRPDRRPA